MNPPAARPSKASSRSPLAVGVALLLAAWAACCLAFPSALWEAHAHDAGRYLLLDPSGDLLPAMLPLVATCAVLVALAAVISTRFMRSAAFRRVILVLSAAAVAAGGAVTYLGAALLAIAPFAFAAAMAAIYVRYAERAF